MYEKPKNEIRKYDTPVGNLLLAIGQIIKIGGLATTIYGIATKDLETTVGGFALIYFGDTTCKKSHLGYLSTRQEYQLERIADNLEENHTD